MVIRRLDAEIYCRITLFGATPFLPAYKNRIVPILLQKGTNKCLSNLFITVVVYT